MITGMIGCSTSNYHQDPIAKSLFQTFILYSKPMASPESKMSPLQRLPFRLPCQPIRSRSSGQMLAK
jgi:hypothetical protein